MQEAFFIKTSIDVYKVPGSSSNIILFSKYTSLLINLFSFINALVIYYGIKKIMKKYIKYINYIKKLIILKKFAFNNLLFLL